MYSRPCCPNTTPRCEPIVMPIQEKVCNRYHPIEQPIICPVNTRIVHHYVPRPVYYPSYTQTEEVLGCPGMTGGAQVNPAFGTNTTPNSANPYLR